MSGILRASIACAGILCLALSGCASRDRSGEGPRLETLGTLTLQEAEGVYLARPGGLAVDDDGSIFVTDFFQKRIVQYDRLGALVATYGAPGHGPGEFAAIGETVLLDDTLVAALDYRQRVFNIFGRRSHRYLGSRRVEGVVTTGKMAGGSAWLAHIDTRRGLGMSLWDLRGEQVGPDLVRRDPLLADRVALPAEYVASEVLRGTFPLVHAAPWGDSALIGFSASPYLLAVNRTGQVHDSVLVPVRARRGVPRDLVDRLNRPKLNFREVFGAVSGLYGLSRTADGHFVVAHFDPELHDGNRITGRVHVSLVSPDRRRACVDREIPVSDAAQPLVQLRGDTVLVLEQQLRGESGAATTLKRYRVTAAGCEWERTDNKGANR